jgi:hypothetical protein
MIVSDEIRELTLVEVAASNRPGYLSAASGLVSVQSWLYVVADDEYHLGVFRRDSDAPGELFRLIDGDLPAEKKQRKKQKPDFEVLLRLPAFESYPDGALLAAGSGSRENRQVGVIVGLDKDGALVGDPQKTDLSFIFSPLKAAFAALNIEGAVVSGAELLLFQRGNKADSANAIIRFSLASFLAGLRGNESASLNPLSVRPVDVGRIGDIPLSFTDAAVLPDGSILFSAVAEDTNDNYNDGSCIGSALGLIAANGTQRWLRRLERPYKIEGLDVRRDGEQLKILMVTDADDIALPAKLLSSVTSI